jgi:hypothetical protein
VKITKYGKGQSYTRILNETLRDKRLGGLARAILVYALSKPPDWKLRSWQLEQEFDCGRIAIRSAMKQLVKADYAKLVLERGSGGRVVGRSWLIRESPQMSWPPRGRWHDGRSNRRSVDRPHYERTSGTNEPVLQTKERTRRSRDVAYVFVPDGFEGIELLTPAQRVGVNYYNAKLPPLGWFPITEVSEALIDALAYFEDDAEGLCSLIDHVVENPDDPTLPKRRTLVRLLWQSY